MNTPKRLLILFSAVAALFFIMNARFAGSGDVVSSGDTSLSAGSAPVYTCRIIHVYPHDSGAFTQGLVFEKGTLYEGTGLRGRSVVRRVRLESGEILTEHKLPGKLFGEGITIFGDRVLQLTWKARKGFVYDMESFRLLEVFQYPTEGWGLTHDGERLIMSDGTEMLYFLDPATYERTGTIIVRDSSGRPVIKLNELEYVKGKIYANIWGLDRIVIINPASGGVDGWIELSGLTRMAGGDNEYKTLNGIAYDAVHDRLFVTGKMWPYIYEIQLTTSSSPAQSVFP